MLFEHEKDALAWYEGEERILTPQFLRTIPWSKVSKYPINPQLIPVFIYMRDVEKMTSTYYQELKMTPTWRDPSVRQFMDRWSAEEPLHGDLLHRFLEETGQAADAHWFEKVQRGMGFRYKAMVGLQTAVAHLFGQNFAAVHMTIGAINELTTLTGYQRLWTLAKHPVLEYVLRAIAREEARHYFFYWSVARIKLLRSGFARRLNRFITSRFWVPVGQGIKRPSETNQIIATLFHDTEGLVAIDQQVNEPAARLPGLEGFRVVSDRIRAVIETSLQFPPGADQTLVGA